MGESLDDDSRIFERDKLKIAQGVPLSASPGFNGTYKPLNCYLYHLITLQISSRT